MLRRVLLMEGVSDMWGWLQGIFDWLMKQLRPLLEWIGGTIARLKWFFVALVAAIMAPINWILDYLGEAFQYAVVETGKLFQTVQAVNPSQAQGWWTQMAKPAALMNCIVPLDYALSIGSLLLGWFMALGIIRAILWIYKLIPFKAS